ncbi:MAG: D-alanyl-D-alanine carboxypeptidase family protein [Solirubrobacterales bacterium]
MRQPGAVRLQGARQRRLSPRRLGTARRSPALLVVASTLALVVPCGAHAATPGAPKIAARAWVLLDAHDHSLLAASHRDASRPMASTTKLMTAYLALRDLPLGRRITAPAYHPIPGESLLGLEQGERVSTRDLLYGLLLPSGNDAAVALADGAAGFTQAFVAQMNRTARRLGLAHTSYANPIGLDEQGNYSSPDDLAALALRLRRERLFRRIVDTPRTTLRTGDHPRTIVNHNDLIGDVPWVNGVKTGYTEDAGYVLVGSGTKKGVTLISVVMGAPSMAARDAGTLALLRYGFSLYRPVSAIKADRTIARVAVANGARDPLALVADHPVRVTMRRGQRPKVNVEAPGSAEAPIRRGQRLGRATVTVDGRPVGRTPLLARYAVGVKPDSMVARLDDALPGPRALVWCLVVAVAAAIGVGIGAAARHRRRSVD